MPLSPRDVAAPRFSGIGGSSSTNLLRGTVVVVLLSVLVLALFVIDLRLQTSNLLTWIQNNSTTGFFVFVAFYSIATGSSHVESALWSANLRAPLCIRWSLSCQSLNVPCHSAPAAGLGAFIGSGRGLWPFVGAAGGVGWSHTGRDTRLPSRQVRAAVVVQSHGKLDKRLSCPDVSGCSAIAVDNPGDFAQVPVPRSGGALHTQIRVVASTGTGH